MVENDANAAAWAEATVGAGAGLGNVIALTVGTGISAGIILNGELQRGETGIAGEAGHIIVNPTGDEQCGCGATGLIGAALLALQRSPRTHGHVVRALAGRITS